MAALTSSRDTKEIEGKLRALPVAAGVKIFAGSLVVLAAGLAKPGTAATGLVAVGRAEAEIDNSAGLAGDQVVPVAKGTFSFANSAAADALSRADVGATCFIADDQTVAKTNGSGTRSAAGTVFDVDAYGVWVTI